jgi:methyl-accepting chemotaxis protein
LSATQISGEGNQVVKRMVEGIAFQTNILALNAAVEARARASNAAASRWWPPK